MYISTSIVVMVLAAVAVVVALVVVHFILDLDYEI